MEIKCYHSLADLSAEDWQAIEDPNFPFADYHFLLSLEKGGAVGTSSGWMPYYLTLWQEGKLLGATYLFEKSHSYGEYIFDWEWAHAYQAHGKNYYPKLLSAVPFTPATGPKFLLHPQANPQANPQEVRQKLTQAALQLVKERALSGLHFLFLTPQEIKDLEAENFLIRHTYQFHFTNQGYQNFADYTQALRRKRRQQTIKERQTIAKSDLEIFELSGEAILPEHLQAMWQFYLNTHWQRGAPPYLTQACFEFWGEHLKQNLVLILAKQQDQWVAGSLNFAKGEALYGRYWGAAKHIPFLHFELCYYRNIEFAIERRLKRFEAGAQGGHKWFRGLVPELTYSAHYLTEPKFHQAVGRFVEEEKRQLAAQLQNAKQRSPYKI